MEVILKFNLPENKSEFEYARKGADAHFALTAMLDELRAAIKYDQKIEGDVTDYWRDRLLEICKDYSLDLYGDY